MLLILKFLILTSNLWHIIYYTLKLMIPTTENLWVCQKFGVVNGEQEVLYQQRCVVDIALITRLIYVPHVRLQINREKQWWWKLMKPYHPWIITCIRSIRIGGIRCCSCIYGVISTIFIIVFFWDRLHFLFTRRWSLEPHCLTKLCKVSLSNKKETDRLRKQTKQSNESEAHKSSYLNNYLTW